MLEGGPDPDMNQTYFQSAFQTTVGILDSILYLTSRHTQTHRNNSLVFPSVETSVSFLHSQQPE